MRRPSRVFLLASRLKRGERLRLKLPCADLRLFFQDDRRLDAERQAAPTIAKDGHERGGHRANARQDGGFALIGV